MIKTYLKIFCLTGTLFFLGMFFSDLTIRPAGQALPMALADGLLFGVLMAAVLGTLHIARVRRAAAGETGRDIYSTTQEREFESGLDYGRLFAAVTHYLEKTSGFELTERDQEAGRVAARAPFNFTTFGSKVTVLLQRRQGAPTLVKVVSRPLLPTTLADYGENFRIARDLQEHLKGTEHL